MQNCRGVPGPYAFLRAEVRRGAPRVQRECAALRQTTPRVRNGCGKIPGQHANFTLDCSPFFFFVFKSIALLRVRAYLLWNSGSAASVVLVFSQV